MSNFFTSRSHLILGFLGVTFAPEVVGQVPEAVNNMAQSGNNTTLLLQLAIALITLGRELILHKERRKNKNQIQNQ